MEEVLEEPFSKKRRYTINDLEVYIEEINRGVREPRKRREEGYNSYIPAEVGDEFFILMSNVDKLFQLIKVALKIDGVILDKVVQEFGKILDDMKYYYVTFTKYKPNTEKWERIIGDLEKLTNAVIEFETFNHRLDELINKQRPFYADNDKIKKLTKKAHALISKALKYQLGYPPLPEIMEEFQDTLICLEVLTNEAISTNEAIPAKSTWWGGNRKLTKQKRQRSKCTRRRK